MIFPSFTTTAPNGIRGCRFLVTTTKARWNAIFNSDTPVPTLEQVVFTTEEEEGMSKDTHYCGLQKWLDNGAHVSENDLPAGPCEEDLAAIVYTSGTTGRPKGVMLTHRAVLSNVQDIAKQMPLTDEDLFLSYLPLSHTFERTATYYNCVAHGATLVFSRGPMRLAEDFKDIEPTVMCSVPRILEQFYAKIQARYSRAGASAQEMADRVVAAGWRDFCRANDLPLENDGLPIMDDVIKALYFDKVAEPVRELFGSRFKYIVSGGAALNGMVAKFFCAMGINIRQAYGLTEYSPVISMNGMTVNHPATVGLPLARCQVRAGEKAAARAPEGHLRTIHAAQAQCAADARHQIEQKTAQQVPDKNGGKHHPQTTARSRGRQLRPDFNFGNGNRCAEPDQRIRKKGRSRPCLCIHSSIPTLV